MAGTIATAYVQIVPTTEGIGGQLSKMLGGEAESAGKSAGSKLGSALGSAAKVGMTSIAALGTAAVASGAALANAASATAQYGDGIDKMSQKLGVSSGFYQEWDAVLQHSGTSMDSMSATFKKLATASQDASADQEAAFKSLGLSMEQVQSMSTEDLFTSVISGLQGMEEGTERTALATQLLGRGAMELGPLLNTSAEDTQGMIDTVHELGGVMSEDAVKASAAFQDSLQDMQTAFTGLKNGAMGQMLPWFTDIIGGITALIQGDGGTAYELILSGVGGISTALQNAIPQISSAITGAVEIIAEVAPDIIESLASGLIDAIPLLLPALMGLVTDIGSMLMELLPQLMEAGVQVVVQLAQGIAEALPELIPAIVNVVSNIGIYLIENIDLLVDAAIQLMIGLAEGLVNAIPVLIEKAPIIIAKLVTAIITNLPKIFNAGVDIVKKLASGVASILNVLVDAGAKMINSIKNAIVAKISQFIEIGKNIVEGLKQGIENAWSSVTGWLGDKVSGLVDTVKDKLKIGSPSRVFANEVGQWIPAGIAQGIEGNLGVIDDAMNEMTSRTLIDGQQLNATVGQQNGYRASGLSAQNGASDVYGLLSTYLPMIARGGNVTVKLEGDAGKIFKSMQNQNNVWQKTTGRSAFA